MLVTPSSITKVWTRTQHTPSFAVMRTAVCLHLWNNQCILRQYLSCPSVVRDMGIFYHTDYDRVLIRRWTGYCTQQKSKIGDRWLKLEWSLVHNNPRLLKESHFQIFLFNLCQITPTQTTYPLLASLGNFNKGGTWLTRDSERLELNTFNRLLSLQLMELLGPKAI